MHELRIAIGRFQLKNHYISVVCLQSCYNMSPKEFLTAWDGEGPDCWRTTCFHMLPKKLRAMHASDFRPMANARILYKVLAYLVLSRIEHTLDTHQPEEEHGFRSKYRLGGHLLTANLLLDKATARGIPVWLVSSHLSNNF